MSAKVSELPAAWLEFLDGRVHRVGAECTIGRLPENHLVLGDVGISRHHAHIRASDTGGYALSDDGSTNGTFLNDVQIAGSTPLRDGDRITVGSVTLRFRCGNDAATFVTVERVNTQAGRTILVVCPPSVLAAGLERLISAERGFAYSGHAGTPAAARQLVTAGRPDAIVLDASADLAGSLTLIRDLLAVHPAVRILVLVERADPTFVARLMRTGALGCVLRADSGEEMVRALQGILTGGIYLSRRVAAAALTQLAGSDEAGRRGGPGGLSDRELEVFHLVGAGRPNRDIATALGMSVKTVETHKENIKVKLGLPTAAAVAERARAWLTGA
jgi:DNA-binding NarL/FixJ family response regulator